VALLFFLLCGMIVGNFWLLGWEPPPPEPVVLRFQALPMEADGIPRPLQERLGPEPLAQLAAIAETRAIAETVALNPISGGSPAPTALGELRGDERPSLSPALVTRLCAWAEVEDGVALGTRMVHLAEQMVRNADSELGQRPWLRERLRHQVLLGAASELERWDARLVADPPVGPRRTVVIRGQARQVSTFVIGHEHASAREAATFDAWADLTQEALGAERFELGLERGRMMPTDDPLSRSVGVSETWVEGWFDWPGWLATVEAGEEPEARPFYELGRLQALQLLNAAGLIELVFLGHGIEVKKELAGDGRYQRFAVNPSWHGDEHQEVLILRKERGGFSLTYGLTISGRAPFWAASCSNRHGGETRPDQSTTAVAFLLANGYYPDAASLDPFVFAAFRALQAALLEAEAPLQAGDAIEAAVRSQVERLTAPGELRGVLSLGPELWLLQVGGQETPDVLLIGDLEWSFSDQDAHRITLASSSWRELEPLPGSRELTLGPPWHPCADADDCPDALDDLLAQAKRFRSGGLPSGDATARYRLKHLIGETWVEPQPDATNRFLRLATLEPVEIRQMVALEDSLRAALETARVRKRIQGWVLTDDDLGDE